MTNVDTLYLYARRQSDDELKADLELYCIECHKHLCDAEVGDALATLASVANEHECETSTCRYCDREIVYDGEHWGDPDAKGEDSTWRLTCDANTDDPAAPHEPEA